MTQQDRLRQFTKDNGLTQTELALALGLAQESVSRIMAGERRFRACQSLGWSSIPAIIREMNDEQAAAVMLAENTSRADLDPVDEATAYQTRITVWEHIGKPFKKQECQAAAQALQLAFASI